MITPKQKLELEAVMLIIIVIVVSVIIAVSRNASHELQFNIAPNISPAQASREVVAPKITVFSQISPDGTKKVIMKETQNQDNTTIYDYSTVDVNNANESHVFTKILDSSGNMIIPFNTWSPDDKYFFIQENTGRDKNIFVFKATGVEFVGGVSYLDVTDLFKKADAGNNFDEATGWASESLIIINTTKKDNSKGPSYWFEVPSGAIIQLSTEF